MTAHGGAGGAIVHMFGNRIRLGQTLASVALVVATNHVLVLALALPLMSIVSATLMPPVSSRRAPTLELIVVIPVMPLPAEVTVTAEILTGCVDNPRPLYGTKKS